jgi:hypothetical protein
MKKLSIVLFVAAAALAGCGGKAKPAAGPDTGSAGSAAGSDMGSATGGSGYGGAAGSATPAPAGSGGM